MAEAKVTPPFFFRVRIRANQQVGTTLRHPGGSARQQEDQGRRTYTQEIAFPCFWPPFLLHERKGIFLLYCLKNKLRRRR